MIVFFKVGDRVRRGTFSEDNLDALKQVFLQKFPEYQAAFETSSLLITDQATNQQYELEDIADLYENAVVELRRTATPFLVTLSSQYGSRSTLDRTGSTGTRVPPASTLPIPSSFSLPSSSTATASPTTRFQTTTPPAHPTQSSYISFERKKLVVIMVGLPARGKTYIARKLSRYLNWLNVATKVFNVGAYRRERIGAKLPHTFYDPNNEDGRFARTHLAIAAMDDLVNWLHSSGRVGVFDATNSSEERRRILLDRLKPEGFSVMFIESICDDPKVVETNVREVKTSSPDYVDVDPEVAAKDFMARIEHYKQAYEPITDDSLRYIKIFNVGSKVLANRVNSYLAGRILFYLLNLHTEPRKIYLTRHGQSMYNLEQRIGGDPELTRAGELYAHRLSDWTMRNIDTKILTVWTSTLKRSIATGKYIPAPKLSLRSLDEIDAGICDGLTYEEVEAKFPDEFTHRALNKLAYRYPRGESYIDLIHRLEPVIFELERQRNPVLVIGHQAILRCLYAYFMDKEAHECPFLPIPMHTVIEIEPKAYGCVERQFVLVTKPELQHANQTPSTPPNSPEICPGQAPEVPQALDAEVVL